MEQVNQMVRQKRFTFKSLALADTGQGLREAGNAPVKRWAKLADLPGFEPNPAGKRRYALLVLIIIAVMALAPIVALIWLAVILNRIH